MGNALGFRFMSPTGELTATTAPLDGQPAIPIGLTPSPQASLRVEPTLGR